MEEVEEEYLFHEESVHVRPGYYSPKQVSELLLVQHKRMSYSIHVYYYMCVIWIYLVFVCFELKLSFVIG